jgi:F-type H+-transporting ATPase subunit c
MIRARSIVKRIDPIPILKIESPRETIRREGRSHMTSEVATILVDGLKYLAAGLAMVGTFGPGLGIGLLAYGALQGLARNPDASGIIQINMILAIAFAEAVAIYALVVAMLIIFVG